MKVVYTQDIFTVQPYGGISRYFAELIRRIPTEAIPVRVIAGLYVNEYLKGLPHVLGIKVPPLRYPASLWKRLSVPFQQGYLQVLGRGAIIHQTYYSDFIPKRGAKYVLTVFDMIHERFPESFTKKDRTSALKRKCCMRADRIVAISQATKNDLVELFGIAPEKITVIHLGNSLKHSQGETETLPGIPEPFLLYVGDRKGYKNFSALMQALAQSEVLKRAFHLVCFGGGPFREEEENAMIRLGIRNRVHQISGNDSSLASCYRRAAAYVCPSLYEGFGVPVLEAMGLSCPVLCSNTGSLPEVAGDAGFYFDPRDIESIRNALESALLVPGNLKALKRAGVQRERMFSWERCTKETAALYRSLLPGGGVE